LAVLTGKTTAFPLRPNNSLNFTSLILHPNNKVIWNLWLIKNNEKCMMKAAINKILELPRCKSKGKNIDLLSQFRLNFSLSKWNQTCHDMVCVLNDQNFICFSISAEDDEIWYHQVLCTCPLVEYVRWFCSNLSIM